MKTTKTLVALAAALLSQFAVASTPVQPTHEPASVVVSLAISGDQYQGAHVTLSGPVGQALTFQNTAPSLETHCALSDLIGSTKVDVSIPTSAVNVVLVPTKLTENVLEAVLEVSVSKGSRSGPTRDADGCHVEPGSSAVVTDVSPITLVTHKPDTIKLPNGLTATVRLDEVSDPNAALSAKDCACTAPKK